MQVLNVPLQIHDLVDIISSGEIIIDLNRVEVIIVQHSLMENHIHQTKQQMYERLYQRIIVVSLLKGTDEQFIEHGAQHIIQIYGDEMIT